MKRAPLGALFLLLFLWVGGCQTLPYGARSYPQLQRLAKEEDFTLKTLDVLTHSILMLSKKRDQHRVHIYIEGDGLAWRTSYEPSYDPTPIIPTGFQLAMADSSGATVIYLSRPGQYVEDPSYTVWDWTHKRFTQDKIDLYLQIVRQIISESPYSEITLLGYSGGGAIALLLAAQMKPQIHQVVTFAGLLDTGAWTQYHDYSPLQGLNPKDYAGDLADIPQLHLVGGADSVVPRQVYESYKNALPHQKCTTVLSFKKLTHWSGWQAVWRDFKQSSLPKKCQEGH